MEVTLENIRNIMTMDNESNKQRHWPLLSYDDVFSYRMDEVRELFPPKGVTFAGALKSRYPSSVILKGKDIIIKELKISNPYLQQILELYPDNVILAGGAFTSGNKSDTDLDLFLYGFEGTDEERSDKATTALIDILNLMSRHHSIHYYRSENAITVSFYTSSWAPIQIILRLYDEKSQILGGFDIPACSIGYDGEDIFMTRLCAWSLLTNCIPVDTTKRSTTYELRLEKYSFKYYNIEAKEFSLLFPGLNKENIIFDEYKYMFGDNMLCKFKDWIYYSTTKAVWSRSDYNGGTFINGPDVPRDQFLSPPDDMFCHFTSIDDMLDPKLNMDYFNLKIHQVIVMLRKYNGIKEQDKHIMKIWLGDYYDEIINNKDLVSKQTRINIDAAPYFADESFSARVKELKDLYISNFKRMQNGICWRIIHPDDVPGDQKWTSSFNPVIEDPRKWYGKDYVPFLIGLPNEIYISLRLCYKYNENWNKLPKDIFKILVSYVLTARNNDFVDKTFKFISNRPK